MPKSRKPAGSRPCEKRIYILCEGSDKHSEYAYLRALIKDTPLKGNTVQIELLPTEKNTGRELVEEAARKIERKFKQVDDAWVVYDQDGYIANCLLKRHPEPVKRNHIDEYSQQPFASKRSNCDCIQANTAAEKSISASIFLQCSIRPLSYEMPHWP